MLRDPKHSMFTRCGAEAAREAHNFEVIRSKRIAGIYFTLFVLKKQAVKLDVKRSLVTGMAQRLARGAHNSEVIRSKRIAGIYIL